MSQASMNKGQCLSQIVSDSRMTRENITLVGKSPTKLVGLFLAIALYAEPAKKYTPHIVLKKW